MCSIEHTRGQNEEFFQKLDFFIRNYNQIIEHNKNNLKIVEYLFEENILLEND